MTPRAVKAARARIARERKTIDAMIVLYCRGHHGGTAAALCPGCHELAVYAGVRLDRCVFRLEKPTCVNCPVHCYTADMRERVKEVMRWSGPRMMWRHPILAVRHVIDGKRKLPEAPRGLRKTTPSPA